jgi:hypothetical protein
MLRNSSRRFLSIFVQGRPKRPVTLVGFRSNHALPMKSPLITDEVPNVMPRRRALVVFDMCDWEGSILAYRAVSKDARTGDYVEIIYRHRDIDACDMDSLIRNAVKNERVVPSRIVPALHCNTPTKIIEYASEMGACTLSIRSECSNEFSTASVDSNINLISTQKHTKPYSFYVEDPQRWVSQKSFI